MPQRNKILVIEKDESVRKVYERFGQMDNLDMHVASDAQEATSWYGDFAREIRMVVVSTDGRAPGEEGRLVTFTAILGAAPPSTRPLLVLGNTDGRVRDKYREAFGDPRRIFNFDKPHLVTELRQIIATLDAS